MNPSWGRTGRHAIAIILAFGSFLLIEETVGHNIGFLLAFVVLFLGLMQNPDSLNFITGLLDRYSRKLIAG